MRKPLACGSVSREKCSACLSSIFAQIHFIYFSNSFRYFLVFPLYFYYHAMLKCKCPGPKRKKQIRENVRTNTIFSWEIEFGSHEFYFLSLTHWLRAQLNQDTTENSIIHLLMPVCHQTLYFQIWHYCYISNLFCHLFWPAFWSFFRDSVLFFLWFYNKVKGGVWWKHAGQLLLS